MRSTILFLPLLILMACSGKSSTHKKHSGEDSATVATPHQSDSGAVVVSNSGFHFPYDLKSPETKWKMPKDLTEISAIATYKKSKLVCVQDEAGEIFIYDLKKGEAKKGVDFGKKGDYEGVANINDTVYVLSSNGTLHCVSSFDKKDQKTNDFKTFLNKSNDTEGLCYDSLNNRLLIACKGDPGSSYVGYRAVYGFNLKSKQLETTPVYLVKLEELKAILLKMDKSKFLGEEWQNIFGDKGDVTFQPSEIAIHPITHDVYMISTVGKLLVILDKSGKLISVQSLPSDELKQPEGLCFFEDGTMFISDEGRSGHGNIFQFKYKPE